MKKAPIALRSVLRYIPHTHLTNRSVHMANRKPTGPPLPDDPAIDFRQSNNWRIFRIMAELTEGWQFLADFKNTITFFGSARVRKGNKWYDEARKLGCLLAKDGYHIVTGSGPGIMGAANRGAVDALKEATANGTADTVGRSIGLHIQLPNEQQKNKFVTHSRDFHYFFVRKVMLSYHGSAYIFFPGGYGSLEELFEILTLVQTKKMRRVPIILVGKEYWGPLFQWIEKESYRKLRGVDKEDLSIPSLVDTAEEAQELIKIKLNKTAS